MINWMLVDDSADEAAAFSRDLTLADRITVTPSTAKNAEAALASGHMDVDGVLMDVDLSNETGMRNTGPGMAQNIRVAQQRQEIRSFPVIRFSYRARVLQSIGRDSSSDDVFDLKIEKDGIGDPSKRGTVQQKLLGVSEVYGTAQRQIEVPVLLGLDRAAWDLWGHASFEADIARTDRPYQAAGRIVRFLAHSGPLIDEDLLAIRLGVARQASPDWDHLKDELAALRYTGVASDYFPRWWARGLESWWTEQGMGNGPLAGCSLDERQTLLLGKFPRLGKLAMPEFSLGDRPWRSCLLTFEDRGEIVPIDPARAVRVAPRDPLPAWMDPFYAALGPALRARDDPRLDKDDLARLGPLARRLQA